MPFNYTQNGSYNEEEGIIGNKFPMCNWNKDEYADWLITNSASLNTSMVEGGVNTLLGLRMNRIGNNMLKAPFGSYGVVGLGMKTSGYSTIAGGLSQIADTVATIEDHKKVPNSTQGLASGGDINFADNRSGFYFYHYSIKREFAKIIDDYFSMFGYKVNSLEVPNLTSRRNWNFLKIIDPNVEGDIVPESDMNKYKEQLKQGITFWHDPTTFRDYSQSNGNS